MVSVMSCGRCVTQEHDVTANERELVIRSLLPEVQVGNRFVRWASDEIRSLVQLRVSQQGRHIVQYRSRSKLEVNMARSSSSNGFGMGNNFGMGANMDNMWQRMEEMRSTFEKRAGSRMGRGDVRAAVLALLAEKPMHGYQIIHEIEERSGGTWKPSAGSVYPTLQLLADEGLVTAEEVNDRKVYSLTDTGREAVSGDESAPWASADSKEGNRFSSLPKAGVELAQAAAQVGRSGSPAQITEAVKVLDDARRRLYSLLAQI